MSEFVISAVRAPTVAARLDRLPATRSIWLLIVLISFGAFFEIYDLGLSAPLGLGLQAAHIFRMGTHGLFGVADQATFVAATFAGLFAGTLGFSAVADRFGRRLVFTVALLWYAAATVVMGLQNSAVAIDIWRFIASVGIGLEMVAIDCYLAELTPKLVRGRAFAISASIQFSSAPLVAVMAWRLIPGDHFGIAGWRWLAIFPSVGAVLIWFVRRSLPESPRWLEVHGFHVKADEVVTAIERRVQRECNHALPTLEPTVEGDAAKTSAPASMWRPPLLRRTLGLIIFHVFQVIGYYGVANWLPTLLTAQGITITKSLGYTAVLALIAPLAPLVLSQISDRVERKWMVVVGALMVAVFGLLLSHMTQTSNVAAFFFAGSGVAVGNSLMSFAYHTYQSEVYPTEIRARGVGVVYSFSRLSAIFSAYLIAATLSTAGSPGVFLLIFTSMSLAALSIAFLGPKTRGASLEAISSISAANSGTTSGAI